MKAFVDPNHQKVQIGNKVYYVITGKIEDAQANRKGIFDEYKYYVEVPTKSLEFAKIAIVLCSKNLNKSTRKK